MITIFKRGSVWWARGSHRGGTIRPRSLGTQSKQVAEKRRTDLELQLDAGITAVAWEDFEAHLLADFRRRLRPSTQKKYEFTLYRFKKFLTGVRIVALGAITSGVIQDYIRQRSTDSHPTRLTPIGPEGIKADLRALHAAFAAAVRVGHIRENPVRYEGLNSNPRGTRPFSPDECAAMLADAKAGARPDLPGIVLAFLTTGFRISDVRGLEKQDVDFKWNQITRRTQKRGKLVYLPLHPALKNALVASYAQLNLSQRECPFVFSSETGRPLKNLDAILRRLWARCGVTGGHAHRFRDTFAVRLLEHGASLYDVAKLLGITVAVAERHYSPYVEELQERGRRFILGLEFPAAAPIPALPAPATENGFAQLQKAG